MIPTVFPPMKVALFPSACTIGNMCGTPIRWGLPMLWIGKLARGIIASQVSCDCQLGLGRDDLRPEKPESFRSCCPAKRVPFMRGALAGSERCCPACRCHFLRRQKHREFATSKPGCNGKQKARLAGGALEKPVSLSRQSSLRLNVRMSLWCPQLSYRSPLQASHKSPLVPR